MAAMSPNKTSILSPSLMAGKQPSAPPSEVITNSDAVKDESPTAEPSEMAVDALVLKDELPTAAISDAMVKSGPVEEAANLPGNDDEITPPHVLIRYTAECSSVTSRRKFRIHQDDEPFNIEASNNHPKKSLPQPVIEIITSMSVKSKRRDSKHSSKKNADEKTADRRPARKLEDYLIEGVGSLSLVVHSVHLKQLIRGAVKYYPSQNLVGETILIKEAFAVLAHHADQIACLSAHDDQHETASLETNSKENHLSILLNFMRTDVEPRYASAKKRLLHPTTPTVTFDDAWYLLKPGVKAYADVNDICLGCIIVQVQLEQEDMIESIPQRWAVKVWFMNKVYANNKVTPAFATIYINTFDGECEVRSLSVYPRGYHDRSDDGRRRKHFEARGRRMQQLIWSGHRRLLHDGELASEPHNKLTGQVIVGAVNAHGIDVPAGEWQFSTPRTDSEPPSAPETDVRNVLPYSLEPKKHRSEYMTQDLLFMMCPVHLAFVLSTKAWVMVNIDNTMEINDTEAPPLPVLDEDSHNIIQALAEYRLKEEKPWSADFIHNKGEGIVIMLHGPPGVGKTYTVESIAVRMRKPLIILSIAEIGIKEDQVKAQLTKWLALAEGWQAILLIDECDIFLERREAFDIARNGVVAAFLRNIEYFSGLLFLTTNRVGHIDEAFMSRVHAIIHFQPLDEAGRKVLWKSLLDKVHRDRPGKITIQLEAIEYINSKEMLQMDWNGREIRNAMQTAIALAEQATKKNPYYREGTPVTVNKAHFESVLRLSKGFKDYLTSIRQEDQNRRARVYYLRNDTFTTKAEEP